MEIYKKRSECEPLKAQIDSGFQRTIKNYLLENLIQVIVDSINKVKRSRFGRELKALILFMYDSFLASLKPPLFILQMGKVGSRSIFYSLEDINYGPMVHFHYLTQEKNIHPYTAKFIEKQLSNKNRQINIICPIREPVSRNISSYFQDYEAISGKSFADYDSNIENLISLFYEINHNERGLRWFDDEFYRLLNINVYDYEFPKTQGFQHIIKGRFNVLIYKLELPDEKKVQIICDFLNLQNFSIRRVNVTNKKKYSNIYKTFLQNIVVRDDYLNDMYNSKYAKHFYSTDEIDKLRSKWKKPA